MLGEPDHAADAAGVSPMLREDGRFAKPIPAPKAGLALGELVAAAGLGAAVLLALHHA
jgi:hypothetical protein